MDAERKEYEEISSTSRSSPSSSTNRRYEKRRDDRGERKGGNDGWRRKGEDMTPSNEQNRPGRKDTYVTKEAEDHKARSVTVVREEAEREQKEERELIQSFDTLDIHTEGLLDPNTRDIQLIQEELNSIASLEARRDQGESLEEGDLASIARKEMLEQEMERRLKTKETSTSDT